MKLLLRPLSLVSALAIAAVIASVPGAARAQNLLANPSFEDGNFTGINPPSDPGSTQLFPGATNITGWTTTNAELAWISVGNPYGIVAPDGNRSLELAGYHDAPPFGGVTQSLATTPGATYNLSFMIGVFGGQTVSITASADASSQTLSFTGNGNIGGNQWGSVGFNFVATNSTTLISLIGATTTNNTYLGLDNASVTLVQGTAAPEPDTLRVSLALLALAAGCALRGAAGRTRRTS